MGTAAVHSPPQARHLKVNPLESVPVPSTISTGASDLWHLGHLTARWQSSISPTSAWNCAHGKGDGIEWMFKVCHPGSPLHPKLIGGKNSTGRSGTNPYTAETLCVSGRLSHHVTMATDWAVYSGSEDDTCTDPEERSTSLMPIETFFPAIHRKRCMGGRWMKRLHCSMLLARRRQMSVQSATRPERPMCEPRLQRSAGLAHPNRR